MKNRSFINQLIILHIALLAGMIMMAVMIVFLFQIGFEPVLSDQWENYLNYFIGLVMLSPLLLAGHIFNKRVSDLSNVDQLKDKLIRFRSSFLIKLVLVEGSVLLLLIFYFLSAYRFYLFLSFLPMGYFISLFPRKEKIAEILDLTESEKEQLKHS